MHKPVKLFIVEGAVKENQYVKDMTQRFFQGRYESKIINLSAEQNIYMLYKSLARDGFDTDIVEVLKETVDEARSVLTGINRQEIDEVFLFFDFDCHQDNTNPSDPRAGDIISAMLEFFNNETEYGKLYISYPMVEALRDYRERECESLTGCWIPVEDVGNYKQLAGSNNPHNSHKMNIEEWREVINAFYFRLKCLMEAGELEYSSYKDDITPKTIYEAEHRALVDYKHVFVLSAFPEFLLDYFKKDFWHANVKRRKNNYRDCQRRTSLICKSVL